jgi:HK97 family phage prohead protease
MEYREFRAGSVGTDDEGKLILRAAPFNSPTIIGDLKRGGWREEIAPGCFTKTLREGDTVLLADHDMAKPISRMSAGTLRLAEDEQRGLVGDADPTPTSYYNDLKLNINSGNKGGCSIGFIPVKDDWYDDEGKPSNRMVGTKRVLREAKLPEVSIVTNPAYKDTAVFARDDSAALLEERAARPRGEEREAPEGEATDVAAVLMAAYNALPDEDKAALPEALRAAFEAPEERTETPEPEASTQETDDDDFALRASWREAEERSRKLDAV